MVSTTMKTTIKAFALVATTMALATIVLSSLSAAYQLPLDHNGEENVNTMTLLSSKRVNRFLGEGNYDHHGRSLKPADHCNKDNGVCDIAYGKIFTCCGNKCFDLTIDKKNCGTCRNKCKFTYDCCDGKCVDQTYDKRHCGKCNSKCLKAQFCVYGMCDYA